MNQQYPLLFRRPLHEICNRINNVTDVTLLCNPPLDATMSSNNTLLLTRGDIAKLLGIEECIAAVEDAFRLYGEGKVQAPSILGVHAADGGFHIKAGIMNLGRSYFVAKANANFPKNKELGLPTIQGVVIVCDAVDGRLLALMDSIEITIIRTGAATAVAAKFLARKNARTALICGCGSQGRISLEAIMKVRKLEKAFAYDIDTAEARRFAETMSEKLGIEIAVVDDLRQAAIGASFVIHEQDRHGHSGSERDHRRASSRARSRLCLTQRASCRTRRDSCGSKARPRKRRGNDSFR